MSKIEVDAVEPQSGTTLTLGASGDTITIPAGATISNSGTAAGFGPTGAVSWNTTKITADPNPAVTGVGYFADTTSAAFTITLPSSPAAGAVVGIADYANTFATNNLTIDRNSSNIGGEAFNAILSTNGVSITLVYVDATQGWIITDSGSRSDVPAPGFIVATGGAVTCCGDYKIHTFTGPGTFTVCSVGNPLGSSTVDYLVVAGGGGGGQNTPFSLNAAGAGGAGGFRESSGTASGCYSASPLGSGVSALPVTAQGYPITVGGGGAGSPCAPGFRKGSSGSNSVFSTITSAGGGGGGSGDGSTPTTNSGNSGGSGGGGSTSGSGGTGNTPPVAPTQGNNGGTVSCGSAGGGGGGGATVAGAAVSTAVGGNGGTGATTSISASPTAYAGGGGGGGVSVSGTGGLGGGGSGGTTPGSSTPAPGTINTGGGGGGGTAKNDHSGGAGGSGIVIIRYKFK